MKFDDKSFNKNANPGPGEYNPDFSAVKNQTAKFSMKGRYNVTKSMNVPAPGTYKTSFCNKNSAP